MFLIVIAGKDPFSCTWNPWTNFRAVHLFSLFKISCTLKIHWDGYISFYVFCAVSKLSQNKKTGCVRRRQCVACEVMWTQAQNELQNKRWIFNFICPVSHSTVRLFMSSGLPGTDLETTARGFTDLTRHPGSHPRSSHCYRMEKLNAFGGARPL